MILEEVNSLLVAGRAAYGNPLRGPFPGILTIPVGVPSTFAKISGNTMGPDPDILIGLYATTGFESERTSGRLAAEVHNLQVLVRAPRSVDAESLSFACFDILDTFVGTLMGVYYSSIMGRSVPFGMGPDENRRFRYTCNYKVFKGRST